MRKTVVVGGRLKGIMLHYTHMGCVETGEQRGWKCSLLPRLGLGSATSQQWDLGLVI